MGLIEFVTSRSMAVEVLANLIFIGRLSHPVVTIDVRQLQLVTGSQCEVWLRALTGCYL